MKSLVLLIGLLMLSCPKQVIAQENQEENLIYALRSVASISQYEDSLLYNEAMSKLVFELTQTLEDDDITKFQSFQQLVNSLHCAYELKQSESSEYAFFTFQYNNEFLNYVLKNGEIVYKHERVPHYFYEVYELKPNEFLVVTLRNDMSFSCHEAIVVHTHDITREAYVLSVCSLTNIDESNLVPDPLTGDLTLVGGVVNYDPIRILYDRKTKSISYSYAGVREGKVVMRKAKYKKGTFVIGSYDARMEVY